MTIERKQIIVKGVDMIEEENEDLSDHMAALVESTTNHRAILIEKMKAYVGKVLGETYDRLADMVPDQTKVATTTDHGHPAPHIITHIAAYRTDLEDTVASFEYSMNKAMKRFIDKLKLTEGIKSKINGR